MKKLEASSGEVVHWARSNQVQTTGCGQKWFEMGLKKSVSWRKVNCLSCLYEAEYIYKEQARKVATKIKAMEAENGSSKKVSTPPE